MISLPTITFAFSLVGIMCMLSIKAYEIRTGKNSILSSVSAKTNHVVHGWFLRIHTSIRSINRTTFFTALSTIFGFIKKVLVSLYEIIKKKTEAHPQSKKVFDMIAGKTPIKRGGASMYLKKIGEDRLMK